MGGCEPLALRCSDFISSRDAYIMEDLYTWCDTPACAYACMCLLKKLWKRWRLFGVVGADNGQHQIRVSRVACNHPCVCPCVRDNYCLK